MIDLIEEVLSKNGIGYRCFNLNEFTINHCWCCYYMRDNVCIYSCRNQLDDMPVFHEMIIASREVIVASAINRHNMAARLMDFLDHLNCIQNLFLLKKPGLTDGKIIGIAVAGHEEGASKTAIDICLDFQQWGGMSLPPSVFLTAPMERQFNTNTDTEHFRNDPLVTFKVKGIVNNVVEMLLLGIEEKLIGKLVPSANKMRGKLTGHSFCD